ncbi:MAG: hypothetical protein WHS86_16225 [Desulfosoma sp.]
MFPHPFQMALMGYWINECHHRDAAEYVTRLEAYARRLEQKLEAALRERAEWEKYGRHVEAFQEIQREMEEQQRASSGTLRGGAFQRKRGSAYRMPSLALGTGSGRGYETGLCQQS